MKENKIWISRVASDVVASLFKDCADKRALSRFIRCPFCRRWCRKPRSCQKLQHSASFQPPRHKFELEKCQLEDVITIDQPKWRSISSDFLTKKAIRSDLFIHIHLFNMPWTHKAASINNEVIWNRHTQREQLGVQSGSFRKKQQNNGYSIGDIQRDQPPKRATRPTS